MFDNDLAGLDAAGTLAAAEANEHTLITAETRRLQIAAHWADLHPGDAITESRLPGSERAIQVDGDGTPTVGDFAAAELGCVLRMSEGSAARLIGDALDLRHRLQLIWAAALATGEDDHLSVQITAPPLVIVLVVAEQVQGLGGLGEDADGPARRPLHDHRETRHRPTSRPHPNRQLRDPRPPPRTSAAAHTGRCVP